MRGANLTVQFKVWHAASNNGGGIIAGWVNANGADPIYSNLRGCIAGVWSSGLGICDAQADWGMPPRLPLANLNATPGPWTRANSKANACWLRILAGDTRGSRITYSTDGGASWPQATGGDTLASGAGTAYDTLYLGFSNAHGGPGAIWIDDITVTGDSNTTSPIPTATPPIDQVIVAAKLVPAGTYYEATVPDTLDLAERGRLAVLGQTNPIDAEHDYRPYSEILLNCKPALLTNSRAPGTPGQNNWGKNAQSLLLAREMCGSTENLDREEAMLKGMLTAFPDPTPRGMLALMTLYRQAPTLALKAQIEWFARGLAGSAQYSGDMAWYHDGPENLNDQNILGVYGYGNQAFYSGAVMRVLSQWFVHSGEAASLDMAGRLKNFLIQAKYWHPEAGPKAVVGSEHGQFMGHHHSFLSGLMGLLGYAEAAHDTALMEFVRESYEYMRNFGIARMGLFGEMCSTGDMTNLALKLSDMGVGDYYEDADGYVRNQLTELQITDAAKLQAAVSQMPATTWINPLDSNDNVVQRSVGNYLSDGCHPTFIPQANLWREICCPGNCTPALYYAWESIVRCKDGAAQINLLLNRASPWLDIDSYLPYEGKVVIHNKTARKLAVRIPRWVNKAAIQAKVGDQAVPLAWLGNYLVIEPIVAGDRITITFPVVTATEQYTIVWDPQPAVKVCNVMLAACPESTDPGTNNPNQPIHPVTYTLTFKGNTLVDIAPRATGVGYPLYQRTAERDGSAPPPKRVTRYIADTFLENRAQAWPQYH